MPTLDWIGKDAVVRHHQEVPTRLLQPDPNLSLAPEKSDPAASGMEVVLRIDARDLPNQPRSGDS